jgi:hypothetical protein
VGRGQDEPAGRGFFQTNATQGEGTEQDTLCSVLVPIIDRLWPAEMFSWRPDRPARV